MKTYHSLTDGTGALQFLRSLVSLYIIEKKLNTELFELEYDASVTEKTSESIMKKLKK